MSTMSMGELEQIANEIRKRVNIQNNDVELELDDPYPNGEVAEDGFMIQGVHEGSTFMIMVLPE